MHTSPAAHPETVAQSDESRCTAMAASARFWFPQRSCSTGPIAALACRSATSRSSGAFAPQIRRAAPAMTRARRSCMPASGSATNGSLHISPACGECLPEPAYQSADCQQIPLHHASRQTDGQETASPPVPRPRPTKARLFDGASCYDANGSSITAIACFCG
jgi:hypothetical protein